jgi:hypothetical protein
MAETRIHIGHHFFGAGNLGDDLMLAGFLHACERRQTPLRLTCAVPLKNHASQRRRFPGVTWLNYSLQARLAAIAACDVWLGLGGTPFQSDRSNRFLDHLAQEADLCRTFGKPMFFLGVGVQNSAALLTAQAERVLGQAEAIWARDPRSADLLIKHGGAGKTMAAADLAHLCLRHKERVPVPPGTVGWVVHFERREMFAPEDLGAALAGIGGARAFWLVQEERRLDFSERTIYDMLPLPARQRVQLCAPDYATASMADLADAWPAVATVVSSRYHGALIAAWRGARLVVIERCDKLTGLAEQLGVQARLGVSSGVAELTAAIRRSEPVGHGVLQNLAEAADRACGEFFDRLPRKPRRLTLIEKYKRWLRRRQPEAVPGV